MRVTALLGGNLRKEATEGPQERTLELASTARVRDLINLLGLAHPRVGQIFLNGKGTTEDAGLKDGDVITVEIEGLGALTNPCVEEGK